MKGNGKQSIHLVTGGNNCPENSKGKNSVMDLQMFCDG
jgi:hypothetical protein